MILIESNDPCWVPRGPYRSLGGRPGSSLLKGVRTDQAPPVLQGLWGEAGGLGTEVTSEGEDQWDGAVGAEVLWFHHAATLNALMPR